MTKNLNRVSVWTLSLAVAAATLASCAPVGQASIDKEASIKGSNLCLINNSSVTMHILWRGFPDRREIPPAGSNCNSGWEKDIEDVKGKIEFEPVSAPGTRQVLTVAADNRYLGEPKVAVAYGPADEFRMGHGLCHGLDVGQTLVTDTGWLHVVAQRVDDSENNKEFVVTFTDNVVTPTGLACPFRE